jgi:hypothetical protein
VEWVSRHLTELPEEPTEGTGGGRQDEVVDRGAMSGPERSRALQQHITEREGPVGPDRPVQHPAVGAAAVADGQRGGEDGRSRTCDRARHEPSRGGERPDDGSGKVERAAPAAYLGQVLPRRSGHGELGLLLPEGVEEIGHELTDRESVGRGMVDGQGDDRPPVRLTAEETDPPQWPVAGQRVSR